MGLLEIHQIRIMIYAYRLLTNAEKYLFIHAKKILVIGRVGMFKKLFIKT